MKFRVLADYFERIEQTSLRNEKTEILAELLKQLNKNEVAQAVYLALGRLRPKFDRLEFALAEKMLLRVVARVVSEKVEVVTQKYQEGGEFAEFFQVKPELSVKGMEIVEVYKRLIEIAKLSGFGSQEKKVAKLSQLLSELEGKSAEYVLRMILSKLRLGFSDKTILDALSYMEYGTKEGRKILDSAYQVFPDVGRIAEVVKESGVESLPKLIGVSLGTPVMSVLAQRLKTADEMIEKMGEVVSEPKFDGQRVQIHYARDRKVEVELKNQGGLFAIESQDVWVRSFTRNLDENSQMFPELKRIAEELAVKEVILDTEAVGYDPKTGEMLPFQMTIKRKRKHSIAKVANEIPLKFYVFDVMYVDGRSLLETPLIERRKILEKIVKPKESGVLVLDDYLLTDNPDELRKYHALQLAKGLEGAMVKKKLSGYLPGRQDFNWVKFKESEDSEAKLADTLDLVVMGYYKGRGKRVKFGLGALLVGVRSGGKILTIAKVGTGMSDDQFRELYQKLSKLERKEKHIDYQVTKILTPDVWVEPELVIEVAGDEITQSPSHSSGVAIRFPRLIKIRDDKGLSEVTTVEEVGEIM